MNFKTLFQVFTLLALLFAALGASGAAQAAPAAAVVPYNMTIWNASYSGSVSAARYEQWNFSLSETTSVVVSAAVTSGDLVPLLSLSGGGLSGSGTASVGVVSATLPAGDYSILIQPQSGSGSYTFTLRPAESVGESVAIVTVSPASVVVGETARVGVGLRNLPAGGLTSAEFACSYDAALVEVSGFAESGLFGADAVTAMNGPANGDFIFAIAGSNGRKATADGEVFSFNVTALQAGSAPIVCQVRVSQGNNALTALAPAGSALSVSEREGRVFGVVHASKPAVVCAYDSANAETCADSNANGEFSLTLSAGTYRLAAFAQGFLTAERPSTTVAPGGEISMPEISLRAGDIDGDGDVDPFDAMTIGMNYNLSVPAEADLNSDGVVNVLDLEALAANYRMTAPVSWE